MDDSIMEVSHQLPGGAIDASSASAEETYVEQLRKGDAAAWSRLVEETGPRLLSYLKYNLPTVEDAEDVLSETFAAAVQAMAGFELRASLTTWLYSLAHRKMVDFWRRNRNTEEIPETLQSIEHRVSLEFREALARLPVEARQAMILRYACDLSTTEVSIIIGRSYKATESLLSRAREKFRAAYGDDTRRT